MLQGKKDFARHNIVPLIAAIIWGSAFIAQELAAKTVEPFTVNAIRSAMSFVFLAAVLGVIGIVKKAKTKQGKRTSEPVNKKMLIAGGLCCGTALASAQAMQQFGFSAGSNSGKGGFITALYIVIVPILGLFFKKKVPLQVWFALLTALFGFYLLCINGSLYLETADTYLFICAILFSVHILLIDYFTRFVDGIQLSCAQFLICGILSAIMMLIFETPTLQGISAGLLPLVYLGIFSSGIAYTLQIIAQKGANPAILSLILSLESVFAALTGAIFGEILSLKEYIGCALIFIAAVLAQLPPIKLGKKKN